MAQLLMHTTADSFRSVMHRFLASMFISQLTVSTLNDKKKFMGVSIPIEAVAKNYAASSPSGHLTWKRIQPIPSIIAPASHDANTPPQTPPGPSTYTPTSSSQNLTRQFNSSGSGVASNADADGTLSTSTTPRAGTVAPYDYVDPVAESLRRDINTLNSYEMDTNDLASEGANSTQYQMAVRAIANEASEYIGEIVKAHVTHRDHPKYGELNAAAGAAFDRLRKAQNHLINHRPQTPRPPATSMSHSGTFSLPPTAFTSTPLAPAVHAPTPLLAPSSAFRAPTESHASTAFKYVSAYDTLRYLMLKKSISETNDDVNSILARNNKKLYRVYEYNATNVAICTQTAHEVLGEIAAESSASMMEKMNAERGRQ